MVARYAWVLNLDADFELAAGLAYAPRKSVQDAIVRHAASLVGTLVRPGDVVVTDASPPGVARGLTGRAFCPTPRALATLARAGATPEPHPSFDVLRRVNSRGLSASLGATMPHASFVRELAAARAKLRRSPVISDAWRVKRSFGFAGRGQRVVRPGESDAFLAAWIGEGGVQVEPNVRVVTEYAMHGMLSPAGTVSLGALVVQTCDANGAWVASERARADAHQEARVALREELTRVAAALSREGYFGPFGVDAFAYRDDANNAYFQPRSEINARYSMGFFVGFGAPE